MSKSEMAYQRARAEATAKVLENIVPQLASGPKILSMGADDQGDVDALMLTNMNGDIFLGISGLRVIARVDQATWIDDYVDDVLRGLKGINGFTVKQLEHIAIGMSGGQGRKVVKRPGWGGRNVTNRGWERKAANEGAEVEE